MELSSALELQAEALRMIYEIGAKSARVLPAYAMNEADLSPQPEDVAIGISRRANHDFQLALRIQGTGNFPPLVGMIVDKARGEAEVARIGAVSFYQASSGGWQRSVANTLMIGCSVSHVQTPCGTLGCFVRLKSDPSGPPHILSCSHVLSQLGTATLGDNIIQPALVDCGQLGHRVVANLSGSSKPDIFRVNNVVDAAFGAIETNFPIDPVFLWPSDKLLGMNVIDPHDAIGQEVFKIGRTSDRTTGTITAINVSNVKIPFGGTPYLFTNQVEITGTKGLFAFYGDSGSLVVSKTLYAIGLLMGGSYRAGRSIVYANPLSEVMDSLSLSLVL